MAEYQDKKGRILYKKIPVSMRDHLAELSGNDLKVWLYFHLRSGSQCKSFPSNNTVSSDTGLSLNTVKTAKANLRKLGWSKRTEQRVRQDGTFSTVVEETHLPWLKNCATVDSTVAQNLDHGTVAQNTDDGKLGQHEVINTEVPEGTVSASPTPIQEPILSTPASDPTGKVSKSVSNNGSVATAPSPNGYGGGSKTVWTDADVDREIGPDQLRLSAEDLYHELFPSKIWSNEDIDMLIDLAREIGGIRGITHGGETIRRAWAWNQTHKQGKLRLFSLAELAKALRSPSERSLLAQMEAHGECKLCMDTPPDSAPPP